MMEEKIKEIVSVFIKVPAEQIGVATPIGRTALQSSIVLHRMYARLAEEGVRVENYVNIQVFGDLLQHTSRSDGTTGGAPAPRSAGLAHGEQPAFISPNMPGEAAASAVGIDIEEVAALPRATDFRREEFYTMNFTAAEIAYCILQADPYSSFAGLFAAKEAIIKADGLYRTRTFNTLEIRHSPEGKPLYPDFGLSISHAGGMAVAVAVAAFPGGRSAGPATSAAGSAVSAGKPAGAGHWIAWIALVLAVTALLIALKL
jgi:phosphopantetheine--protein transferase-like protein